MFSFSCISLVASTLLFMPGISHATSVPKTRGLAGGQGLSMAGKAVTASVVPTSLGNVQNVAYTVNITLGGQSFPVQLDTGSADLWVSGPNTQNIRISGQPESPLFVRMVYGGGNASGNAMFADLEFGGFTVANQAFVLATDVNDEPLEDFSGIMGVGFNAISNIDNQFRQTFDSSSGSNSISNILSQNDVSASFDVRLNRINDSSSESTGTLFIGSHDVNFSNITQQPQLPQVAADQWSVAMDGMKVNGTSFTFNQSSVSAVPNGKIAVALDTGTSFALLPPAAVDFIYGGISGSIFVGESDSTPFQWLVPCNGTTNLSFTFGGVDFPVHYLDLAAIQNLTLPINGQNTSVTFCSNAFQYLTLDPADFPGFDALLGDSFLRNVYASFNFGVSTTGGQNQPFVQMIPTTNFETALPDFQSSLANTLASFPQEISPADLIQALEQLDLGDTSPSTAGQSHGSPSSTASSSSASTATSSNSPKHNGGSRVSHNGLYYVLKTFISTAICILASTSLVN